MSDRPHLEIDLRTIAPGSAWATEMIAAEMRSGNQIDLLHMLRAMTNHTRMTERQEREAAGTIEPTQFETYGGPPPNAHLLPDLLDAAWERVVAGQLRPGWFDPTMYASTTPLPATIFAVIGATPFPN